MSHPHRKQDVARVSCAVITVSDTRSEADDTSGRRIRELLKKDGHDVRLYRIVKDDPGLIGELLRSLPEGIEAVICNGGTGLARRDSTFEAITALLDKEIPGFGELFRSLSYEQIGAAAMLSRATAGVMQNRVVFSLPGSTAAVELAMTKLILPEIGHMAGLVRE